MESDNNQNSGGQYNDNNGKKNGNGEPSYINERLYNESIDGLHHNTSNNIISTSLLKNQKQKKITHKRRVKSNNHHNNGGKDNDIHDKDNAIISKNNGHEESSFQINILSNESKDRTNLNMLNNIKCNVNIINNFDNSNIAIKLESLKQHQLFLKNKQQLQLNQLSHKQSMTRNINFDNINHQQNNNTNIKKRTK